MASFESIKRALDSLTEELHTRDVKFILTGSICFQQAGLDLGRPINDIDIIAIRTNEGYAFADLIEKSQLPLYGNLQRYSGEDMKAFKWKDIPVNIFFYSSFEAAGVVAPSFKGFLDLPCRSIGEILAKKKSYGRKKDLEDIQKIVSAILDPSAR